MDSDSYRQDEYKTTAKENLKDDCDTKNQKQDSLKPKDGPQSINTNARNILLPSWICRVFQIYNGEMESFLRQYNTRFLPGFSIVIWLLLAFW